MMPILAASGCVHAVSGDALCDATSASRTAHAAALAEDGGDRSVITGAYLIRQIDAACQ
jgi:hypothetical protein